MNTASNQVTTAAGEFDEIEQLAAQGATVFQGAPSITRSMQLAETVDKLRAQLTPARMAKVMALMNTSLGFDTDRNPVKWKSPEPCIPYTAEVVRDVFIEASFRGFYPMNCEFSIIAGKFYGGVNGFERLVRKHADVTDFKDNYSLPVFASDRGGATLTASATWMQKGVAQSITREFAIRVNAGMGADAVLGKAKRKLYAAVYARLSGVVTPEGETDDVPAASGQPTAAATPSENLFVKKQAATAPAETAPAPATKAKPNGANATKWDEAMETPQQELARFLTESGVSFDSFRDFVRVKNLARDPDAWGSFSELPEKVCAWFKENPKTMAELVRKFGNVQQPAK